ncbi:MAG TPA: hypothetical protein VEY67_12005 [Candidatus Dormibacteraeota bacterium]|nr:hypothetical protein [Candidatus Dormibacteraeota bacterium]
MLDSHDLEVRITRARRRVDDAIPSSPEWAAAIEEVEELEARLIAQLLEKKARDRRTAA